MSEGTLLIVDDDPALREALAAVLEQGGYATQQAGDGEEGLKRLKDEPDAFDGVLLDWKMPRMDGLTMLRHIKADPRTAPLPVIFQTGSGDEQVLKESLAAGAHYFLSKPVRRQELLATVYTAVQGRRRQRELWGHVRDSARTLSLMDLGRFRYRTQEEAENLTYLLAAACPDPDRAAVGLAGVVSPARGDAGPACCPARVASGWPGAGDGDGAVARARSAETRARASATAAGCW